MWPLAGINFNDFILRLHLEFHSHEFYILVRVCSGKGHQEGKIYNDIISYVGLSGITDCLPGRLVPFTLQVQVLSCTGYGYTPVALEDYQ